MAEIILPQAGRPYVTVLAQGEGSPIALDAAELIALYKAHGALLLRGFATDLSTFRSFAAQFCAYSVFNESPGRQLLDPEHNIQSVNGGMEPFPLHPELSREPWKPDVCFFGCLSAPGEGGETTLCDGVDIVRHLQPMVRDELIRRRLLYIQPADPETLRYWLGTATPNDAQLARPPAHCPYAFFRAGPNIVRVFTRPALHKPMFTDEPAFGNFLLFARYYLRNPNFPALSNGQPVPPAWVEAVKQVSDRLTAAVSWQKSDILMLDNSRFMHGRNAIRDTAERQIASYFGYLHFAEPSADEPAEAPWRHGNFRPPVASNAGAAPGV